MWLASEEENALSMKLLWQPTKIGKPYWRRKKWGRGENWAQEDIGTIDVDDLLEESEIYFD